MSELIAIDIEEGLQLVQISEPDAPFLYAIIDNERAYLRRFLVFVDKTTEVGGVLNYISECDAGFYEQRGVVFTIRQDDKIIGSCGIHKWNHELKQAEIGYWISESYTKQGIVTRCVEALMRYGFQYLSLEKMEIRFVPNNEGSRRIAEKCGFKIEGILRKSYLLNGKLEDLVVSGILREEWKVALNISNQ